MKRFLMAIALLATLCISGCGNNKNTLYIYNWTYYIPDTVIKKFEQKYNVKVVYDVFASNEEMYAKLKAGGGGYDLVFPSGDYCEIMAKEGMLEQLDKTKIPNFKYIDTRVLKNVSFDKGNTHSIPYMMAAAGIAVNKDKVKNYTHSSNIFNRTDLQGKMTMLDDMREVIGLALKNQGYSVNSKDPKQLEKAKKVAAHWKKNLLKYDAESFAKGFAAGEFLVVQGYAENIFLELDPAMKEHVDFFIPKEGSPMYIDSMVMLKTAKHKDLAYTFINFIQEPEIYAEIVDYLGLPGVNTAAQKLRKNKPHYTLDDLGKSETKNDLGKDLDLYNKIWEELRI